MPIRSGSTSGCSSQHVEAATQVPDVLGQRVPARHGGVDEVGVARVVVLGVPVQALAEAAQVRRQHDIAPAGQLERVVGVRHVGVLQPDHLGLPRPVAVAGEDGRARVGASSRAVGDEQVGRHRHGVLGVEDDLVPPVAVAGDRLEGLDVERDRRGLGAEELGQAGAAPLHPGGKAPGSLLGEGVLVGGGGQTGHPLVPGRVVPGRRGEDEVPGVIAHGRPFLVAAVRRSVGSGGRNGRVGPVGAPGCPPGSLQTINSSVYSFENPSTARTTRRIER